MYLKDTIIFINHEVNTCRIASKNVFQKPFTKLKTGQTYFKCRALEPVRQKGTKL